MALDAQQLSVAELKLRKMAANHPDRPEPFVNWLAILEALGRSAEVLQKFRGRLYEGTSEQAIYDAFLGFCQRNSLSQVAMRTLMATLVRFPSSNCALSTVASLAAVDSAGIPVAPDQIAKALERARTLAPTDTKLAHQLGTLQQITGHPEKAVAAMSTAFEADPAASGLARTLASAYTDLDRYSEAADVLITHQTSGTLTHTVAQELFAYLIASGRYSEAWTLLHQPIETAAGRSSLAQASTFLPQWYCIVTYQALKSRIDPRNPRHRLMAGTLLSIAKPYYHAIPLASGLTTLDVGGILTNSPVEDPMFSAVLGDLIFKRLGDIRGKTVVDIGGADGYFTIRAAQAGASVTYVEPDPLFGTRTKAFAEMAGVDGRIRIVRQSLQPQHRVLLSRTDICLALGVVYHFNDMIRNLQCLLPGPRIHVIEIDGRSDLQWTDADARAHRDKEPVSLPWVKNHLKQQGFTVEDVPEWAAFAARFAKSRGRELWIAKPVQ